MICFFGLNIVSFAKLKKRDYVVNKDLMSAPDRFLSRLESLFSVTLQDAREIMFHFHEEMRRGLAGEKSSLKMIPSFVGRPKRTEKGNFLALDLGGTNIRVLAVALDGKGNATLAAVSRFVLPHETMGGAGDRLFDFIADCIQSFFREHHIDMQQAYDLAFTFSFPVEQCSVASGKLICWTKGFTASGVEGKDVVTLLTEALQRKEMGFIHVAALANDTVGTLVAQSYTDPACDMGVILGTGTNACYPEKIARILKYHGSGASTEMIVNMEWGGFDKLKTNVYDQILDRASHNAGRQQLEKMVSGMYLGEIARLVIIEMIEKGLLFTEKNLSAFSEAYALTTEHLSMAAQGSDFFEHFGLADVLAADRQTMRKICRIVSTRSARIAGAAIAAVVAWMDADLESNHTVAIDGALFEKYPGFQGNITDMLRDVFGNRAGRIKLEIARDGPGIGSAIIGSVAASAYNYINDTVGNLDKLNLFTDYSGH
jgi:hexokinase